MALLYFAFAQIPLVGVVVVASAMGRRLPKGVTPSSNLAVVGRGWISRWNGDRSGFEQENGRQRKGAQKGIEMRQQLRQVCHRSCALQGRF
jgi:hypothetical protein